MLGDYLGDDEREQGPRPSLEHQIPKMRGMIERIAGCSFDV